MKSICLVNSFGPMASTVVASIIEHMGFLNIPLRKLRLNDYLLGNVDSNDKLMINKFIEILNSHNQYMHQGGINEIDKLKKKVRLINKNTIDNEINSLLNREFKNPVEMYSYLRDLYSKATVYKEIPKKYIGHIELTTDLYKFNQSDLYDAYTKNFKKVFYINIIRNFNGWFCSLSTQWWTSKKIRERYQWINIQKVYNDHKFYKEAYLKMPGLNINFDDIFMQDKSIIKKISDYLNFDYNKINWEEASYDLYGKKKNFKETFTKSDDNSDILSKFSLDTLNLIVKKKFNVSFFIMTIFRVSYLIDSLRYNIKLFFLKKNF